MNEKTLLGAGNLTGFNERRFEPSQGEDLEFYLF
jgi:hypothetical protein